jgi:hypothetical protein
MGVDSWITRVSSKNSSDHGGLKHPGFTAFDLVPVDQKHRHKIHTVTVRPLRRGATNAVGGIDAKLVCLHIPRRGIAGLQ